MKMNARTPRPRGSGPARLGVGDAVSHVLHKHHLAPGSQGTNVRRVARDLVGLHATDPLSPYLSVLARMPDFESRMLDRELYEKRALARIPAMRNTLFIVPKALVGTLFAATRRISLQSSWRYFASRLSHKEFEEAVPRVVQALAGRELAASELRDATGLDCDVPAVIKLLCDEGVLVRAHPVRGWRDAHHTYALMTEWLPGVDITARGEADSVRDLVRNYLATYGPVSEADVVWWTGLAKASVRAALSDLSNELAEIELADVEGPFLMLRSDLEQVEHVRGPKESGMTLLPMLDPYLQGYRDRRRVLDPQHTRFVIDPKGNATSTILLGERVVGVWDVMEKPKQAVRLHLFVSISEDHRAELHDRAKHVGQFVVGSDVDIQEFRTMIPLSERRGWVRSPLEGASDPSAL